MVGQCQETSITSKTTGMFIQIIALNTDSCLFIIQLNCIQVFLNYFSQLKQPYVNRLTDKTESLLE